MDTWAIQAVAHASLASGQFAGPIPVIGAGQTNNFALGTGLAVLAFAATRVSRQFDPMRRPAVAQLAARWSRICQRHVQRLRSFAPKIKIRSARRVDPVLAEQAGEQLPTLERQPPAADEIFWPTKRSAQTSPGGYQSKHRATGSAKQAQRARRAPRHAAPPAGSSARATPTAADQ
jgi:hypothetical protein